MVSTGPGTQQAWAARAGGEAALVVANAIPAALVSLGFGSIFAFIRLASVKLIRTNINWGPVKVCQYGALALTRAVVAQ
jgi:hypothetical protein